MTDSGRSMSQPMTPIPGQFAGKLVLVTGAGSGIGAATAKRFAAEGAHVFVTDLEGDPAHRVAAEFAIQGRLLKPGSWTNRRSARCRRSPRLKRKPAST